jgi:cytochrome b6-f complex iron-sulfur subunit
MPLIDDLRVPMDDRERARRAFLQAMGGSALALAALGTGATAVRFLWPEVLFEPDTRFAVGRPEEIPVGSLTVLPAQRVFIAHEAAGFYAMGAVCTHLGCLVQYERERNRLLCPCHGSQFSTRGEVTQGPAPRPLPRLQLAYERGQLVVDVARVVDQDTYLTV